MLQSNQEFRVLILGSGSKEYEQDLIKLAQKEENQGKICLLLGYDPLLANQVYTAGDFFLIPSQYEPCGLTDYIAQLAGNLPIVHHVGGLVKVEDGINGFAFKEYAPEALVKAMQRALEIFDSLPEEILKMQKTAVTLIKENYTWDQVVLRYLKLYEKAAQILD